MPSLDCTLPTPARLAPQRRFSPDRWLAEPRPIEHRLPDPVADRDLVTALFAGAEERPDRPLDPEIAGMVYSTIEYLTRSSGILFATLDRVVEITAAAITRRNAKRVTPLGKVTRSKVQAVARILIAAGWLTVERKTCRARILVVSTPTTERRRAAVELAAALSSSDPAARALCPGRAGTIEHCPRTTGSPYGLCLCDRVDAVKTPEIPASAALESGGPEREIVRAACSIVEVWRAVLRCRRSPNPAGAWYRFLVRYLSEHPSDMAGAAWAANEAIAGLVSRHGAASLSWGRVVAEMPRREHGPRVWSTPERNLRARG